MAAKKTRRKGSRRKAYGPEHPNFRERSGGRFVSKQAIGPDALRVGAGSFDDLGGADGIGAQAALEAEIKSDPFVELGATGLRQYSGILDEEFLPALRGRRAMQVYTEMRDNDPTVGAMLFAVEMLMRAVEWRVEPGGDDPADVELADFVDSARGDMSETWSDTISSILSFLPFGFSVHEEVYKRREGAHPLDPTRDSKFDDGRIGWRKLPVRAQDTVHRWIFARDEPVAMVQLPPPSFTLRTIPGSKYLNFRTTSAKANPQGRSVLRNAYRPWYFKRRIEEIEGIGIERDLAGLPKMEVPAEILHSDAPPAKKALAANLKAMLRDVRRDEREGILIPLEYDKDGNPRYKFELVRSGGRRQFNTTEIVNRYDRLIASVVLADFILLGQQRVGAFSLAESKTELFGVALGAWLDMITDIFNRQAIPRLLAQNGIRVDRPPMLKHGDVETVDLSELGDYVAKLTGAGMPLFPDDQVENVLRTHAGLPEKDPEAELDDPLEDEDEDELGDPEPPPTEPELEPAPDPEPPEEE